MSNSIKIKRIYAEPSPEDGYRILVDRLWPRGMTKEAAHINEWNKTIAPSTELRKWFGHQMEHFAEFEKEYKQELKTHTEELHRIKNISETQNLTLLYAAKSETVNHAIVLQSVLNTL